MEKSADDTCLEHTNPSPHYVDFFFGISLDSLDIIVLNCPCHLLSFTSVGCLWSPDRGAHLLSCKVMLSYDILHPDADFLHLD